MEPVLGTIGILCVALTLVVSVARWQHNADSTRQWSWKVTGVAVGVLGSIGGGLIAIALVNGGTISAGTASEAKIVKVPVSGPTVTLKPAPPSPVPISFVAPTAGSDFTICGVARGKATLADGQVVVVGVEEPAEDRWYFESSTAYDADRTEWSTHIELGEQKGKFKMTYRLIALVMTAKEASYLTSTQVAPDPDTGDPLTYWSSKDLPPNGVLGSQAIEVTRVPTTKGC